jgi:septum formation protein
MLEPRIYLASRSPRRRELLSQAGIGFDVLMLRNTSGEKARPDEALDEAWLPGETPQDYVQRVSAAKGRHGAALVKLRRLPIHPVLAADTTIDLDGEVIGKPADTADAVAILNRLSGRQHRVLTAVTLALPLSVAGPECVETVLSISDVRFRSLGADEIRRYVQSGEPMDKAGAYAIQGRAAAFVEEIRGSHSGIVGLPLCEVVVMLRRFASLA